MSLNAKINTACGMTYVLPFGKYQGHTVGDVITINPDYLLWAEKNVDWFKLTDKVRNLVEDCSAEWNDRNDLMATEVDIY